MKKEYGNTMREKPIYYSIPIIILMPILVIILVFVCKLFFGLQVVSESWLNKLFHFLGGVSISISTAGVLWHFQYQRKIVLSDTKVFWFLVFGFLCFYIISWEIMEYIFIFPYYPEYVTYPDTINDIIYGLTGGLIAVFLVFSSNKCNN